MRDLLAYLAAPERRAQLFLPFCADDDEAGAPGDAAPLDAEVRQRRAAPRDISSLNHYERVTGG